MCLAFNVDRENNMGRMKYQQVEGELEGIYELVPVAPQRCCPGNYIFFLFRDSGYYMRTPSVNNSEGFLPMLRVLRNPKYYHYAELHKVDAEDAKAIVFRYSHSYSKGKTRRFALRDDVRAASICSLTRSSFNLENGFEEQLLEKNIRTLSQKYRGRPEAMLESIAKRDVAEKVQETIEETLKKSLLCFFPSELHESIAETILASANVNARRVFLRNNSTDNTD